MRFPVRLRSVGFIDHKSGRICGESMRVLTVMIVHANPKTEKNDRIKESGHCCPTIIPEELASPPAMDGTKNSHAYGCTVKEGATDCHWWVSVSDMKSQKGTPWHTSEWPRIGHLWYAKWDHQFWLVDLERAAKWVQAWEGNKIFWWIVVATNASEG